MAAVYCFSNFVQEYEQVCQAGAPFSESVLTSLYKSLTVCIFHNVIPHQGLKNFAHLTCKADWPVVAGFISTSFFKNRTYISCFPISWNNSLFQRSFEYNLEWFPNHLF